MNGNMRGRQALDAVGFFHKAGYVTSSSWMQRGHSARLPEDVCMVQSSTVNSSTVRYVVI